MSDTTMPLVARVSSALLDLQSADPSRAPRRVLYTVIGLFALMLLWSIFGQLDIVAVAEGKLVPETYTKIVQPSEPGVVKEILVHEGDEVKAGQVLMRLDGTLTTADGKSVDQELGLQRLELARVEAELSDRPLITTEQDDPALAAQARAHFTADRQALQEALAEASAARDKANADLAAAQETLEMLRKTLPTYEATAKSFEELAASNLAPGVQAQEKRRDAIEKSQALKSQEATVISLQATIIAANQRYAQTKSNYRSKLEAERSDTLSQVQKLEQESVKQGYRSDRLELKAPQDGIVKDVATTTVGAVVQPGTVLLTVVPKNEALVAEVLIKNEDSGFVEVGQKARIKLAAYPFQKYGMLEGTVINVGAEASDQAKSTSSDESKPASRSTTYKAEVRLAANELIARGMHLELRPGMQVVGEIRQGKRSVLEYLLSPVRSVASSAGEER
jgi:hemolysin D